MIKEAIKKILESIYDSEFSSRSGSVLRRIKEEWGTSRWFLEFDIRKCDIALINKHRLLYKAIFKEEIDDPKFFYGIHKVFYAGRPFTLNGPYSVPHSVLLSALPGNIYLHKLDREIERIRHKYEIPIVQRIRLVLLGRIDDQENSGEEASFNAPQDNRAAGRSIQRKAAFHSLISSWHTPPTSTPRLSGDQKTPFSFPPKSLATFLNKPSSLLASLVEADVLIHYYKAKGGEHYKNWPCLKLKYSKKTLYSIREAKRVIRSERGLARKPLNPHYLIRICYARYADNLLLGIVGASELLIEIQKRIAQFLQSGLWSTGSTTAQTTVEFLGMVIREVPTTDSIIKTPIQFLRELEKRLRIKHRIHACHLRSAIHSTLLCNSFPIKTKGMSRTGSLLDAVQLAETLGTAGSPQVSWERQKSKHIWQGSRPHSSSILFKGKVPSDQSRSGTHARSLPFFNKGRKAAEEVGGHWARFIRSEFPIQIEAPIKKILKRLRDRGLISRRKPWPIHVACLTNVSDGDIVNWSAGIAISPLSYYRCRDNFDQVRMIVDHQIRWSAIFTPAHKHKSSARNIIPKYSKDSNIVPLTLPQQHRAWETLRVRSRSEQQGH